MSAELLFPELLPFEIKRGVKKMPGLSRHLDLHLRFDTRPILYGIVKYPLYSLITELPLPSLRLFEMIYP